MDADFLITLGEWGPSIVMISIKTKSEKTDFYLAYFPSNFKSKCYHEYLKSNVSI